MCSDEGTGGSALSRVAALSCGGANIDDLLDDMNENTGACAVADPSSSSLSIDMLMPILGG